MREVRWLDAHEQFDQLSFETFQEIRSFSDGSMYTRYFDIALPILV